MITVLDISNEFEIEDLRKIAFKCVVMNPELAYALVLYQQSSYDELEALRDFMKDLWNTGVGKMLECIKKVNAFHKSKLDNDDFDCTLSMIELRNMFSSDLYKDSE